MAIDFKNIKAQYITHYSDKYEPYQLAEMACKGGINCIQLRMKKAKHDEIIEQGLKIREICDKYNAIFILNDKVELVKTVNADGVHVGKDDMSVEKAREILGNDKIIGGTANTFEDILLHYKYGADYIGLGPYRFTKTKENLNAILARDGYMDIIEKCVNANIIIPIYAIGGIRVEDIRELSYTGISGIALSSVINNSENPIEKSKEIIKELEIYFK